MRLAHPMLWIYCYSCGLTFPAMAKAPCCECERRAKRLEDRRKLWRETRETLARVIYNLGGPIDTLEHLRHAHGRQD